MTGAAPRADGDYISRAAFRRWCEDQPQGRFERIDGRIVAMAPERGAHLRVKGAIYRALDRAVRASGLPSGLACQALPDGATVEAGDSDYEPDALVTSGVPMGDDDTVAANPVIIVEVLSPGSIAADTGAKLADYFLLPSLHHYLILHPTRRSIIHHQRRADGIDTRIVAGGTITLDPPGLAVTIEEIYGA